MNEPERYANASLRALADAYAAGRLDREGYRSRRRRVLQTLIDRGEITRPAAVGAGPPINDDVVTLLLASRRGFNKCWWLGLMGAAAVCVFAIAYWILEQGNG